MDVITYPCWDFSGGFIVFVVGESDKQGFLEDLEPSMSRHEDAGLWKRVTQKTVTDYKLTDGGTVFIFKVLWKYQHEWMLGTSFTSFVF